MSSGTTFKRIGVKLNAAPGTAGSGNAKDFVLRIKETDTALTCRVKETATSCSFAADVANRRGRRASRR